MIGCLGLLLVLAVLTGEAFSFVVAHKVLATWGRDLVGGSQVSDTILLIILLQVAMIVAGVLVVKSAVNRLPAVLMGSMLGQGTGAGRLLIGLFAGILLIVPGFFLDVVAVLLLLPPVQALFGAIGQRVAMSLVRQQMAKMFPGGKPGMAGGFPFGAGTPFPGMQPRGPLTPDLSVGRGGKIVDVTAERVDKG
jgi:UPF0716 family protein affecting phage T7 exclusion